MKRRTNFYIDGFNFYCALQEANLRKYLWVDLQSLCKHLTKRKTEVLHQVKYFTTIPPDPPDKRRRHLTYLEALQTQLKIQIFFGKFYNITRRCKECHKDYKAKEEKRTDINVASQLFHDLITDAFDVAYLVTEDSDFVPALEVAKRLYPEKKFGLWFPPGRKSGDLVRVVDFHMEIPTSLILKCQFPEIIAIGTKSIVKPTVWR